MVKDLDRHLALCTSKMELLIPTRSCKACAQPSHPRWQLRLPAEKWCLWAPLCLIPPPVSQETLFLQDSWEGSRSLFLAGGLLSTVPRAVLTSALPLCSVFNK